MDKTITGLLAVASVVAIPAAHAASAVPTNLEAAMRADSYADLLKPIPNAAALLKASAAAPAVEGQEADPLLQQAQLRVYVGPPAPAYYPPYYYYRHHHHHHHWYHHHHHHHHHHNKI
jgi:hypothetical protein